MGHGSANTNRFLTRSLVSPIWGALGYQNDVAKDQAKQLRDLQNQPPPPLGAPPVATEAGQTDTLMQRQKKLQAMRYGFASTISNLSPMNPTGLKTLTGQ